jgi:hypothetical protein
MYLARCRGLTWWGWEKKKKKETKLAEEVGV